VVLLLECFTARLLYPVLKSDVPIIRDRCRSPHRPVVARGQSENGSGQVNAGELESAGRLAKADFKAAWETLKAKT
jgi:hypothetical protein